MRCGKKINGENNYLRNVLSSLLVWNAFCIISVIILNYNYSIWKSGGLGNSIFAVLMSLAVFVCFVEYIKIAVILPSEAMKKRKNTLELSKDFHGIPKDELIKLLIVENYCPTIRRVYLEDKGYVRIVGKHSSHRINLEQDGALLITNRHDSRSDIEANEIMRFLVQVSH